MLLRHKQEASVEAEVEVEVEVEAFRVITFAYRFKHGSKVLEADKEGIYHPVTEADIKFLEYQVSKQLIAYS